MNTAPAEPTPMSGARVWESWALGGGCLLLYALLGQQVFYKTDGPDLVWMLHLWMGQRGELHHPWHLAYLPLLAGMVLAVFAGTWVGNRLRARVPEARFRQLFRWTLTLLALRLILRAGV